MLALGCWGQTPPWRVSCHKREGCLLLRYPSPGPSTSLWGLPAPCTGWSPNTGIPSLLSLEYRAARTLVARPRVCSKNGKCSAERLPSSDATPCRCCLGVFRSFLLLPYCSMLGTVGTGGSHPPLFPSLGFAIPPGSSIPQGTSLGQDAQGRAIAVAVFFSHCLSHPKLFCPFPNAGRRAGTLAQVPACHLHLTLCSPLNHGQGTPPALPMLGCLCPDTHPAPAGLSLLHPPQTTASKEPAGTKSFLHPPLYQEPGADLLSVKPWKVEG